MNTSMNNSMNDDNDTITIPADLMLSAMQDLTEATASLTALLVTAQKMNAAPRAARASFPTNRKILAHLRKEGSISPMEALVIFGIMRLAPAIHDLRAAGHEIKTDIRTDTQGKHYARYTLEA